MLCCRSFNASPTSASPLSTDILHCLHVRTLAMVKPDALKNFGAILGAVEAAGFTVGRLRMCQLTPAIAQGFYAVHADRPFFGPLTEFMSSGRIVAMELVAPGEYPPFMAPCSQAPSSTTPACIISSEHCPLLPSFCIGGPSDTPPRAANDPLWLCRNSQTINGIKSPGI